jgi:hypothetical protein
VASGDDSPTSSPTPAGVTSGASASTPPPPSMDAGPAGNANERAAPPGMPECMGLAPGDCNVGEGTRPASCGCAAAVRCMPGGGGGGDDPATPAAAVAAADMPGGAEVGGGAPLAVLRIVDRTRRMVLPPAACEGDVTASAVVSDPPAATDAAVPGPASVAPSVCGGRCATTAGLDADAPPAPSKSDTVGSGGGTEAGLAVSPAATSAAAPAGPPHTPAADSSAAAASMARRSARSAIAVSVVGGALPVAGTGVGAGVGASCADVLVAGGCGSAGAGASPEVADGSTLGAAACRAAACSRGDVTIGMGAASAAFISSMLRLASTALANARSRAAAMSARAVSAGSTAAAPVVNESATAASAEGDDVAARSGAESLRLP